jgi:hypothetical protein
MCVQQGQERRSTHTDTDTAHQGGSLRAGNWGKPFEQGERPHAIGCIPLALSIGLCCGRPAQGCYLCCCGHQPTHLSASASYSTSLSSIHWMLAKYCRGNSSRRKTNEKQQQAQAGGEFAECYCSHVLRRHMSASTQYTGEGTQRRRDTAAGATDSPREHQGAPRPRLVSSQQKGTAAAAAEVTVTGGRQGRLQSEAA